MRCALLLIVAVVLNPVPEQLRAAQAPAQPAPAAVGPNLTEAVTALTASLAAASKAGINVACAVVDARGELVALQRMDGARFFVTDVARGKALTSALFGQPSGNVAQMVNSPMYQHLNAATQGHLYPMQGAVPIMRNNQLYGAIGCSGGTSQQDEDAAKAGLSSFLH
jgi:glc operon protein GlcG